MRKPCKGYMFTTRRPYCKLSSLCPGWSCLLSQTDPLHPRCKIYKIENIISGHQLPVSVVEIHHAKTASGWDKKTGLPQSLLQLDFSGPVQTMNEATGDHLLLGKWLYAHSLSFPQHTLREPCGYWGFPVSRIELNFCLFIYCLYSLTSM